MSSVLESLPDRPLTTKQLTALNHADAFDLVVPVETEEAVDPEKMEDVEISEGVILATESWVKGIAYDDASGWTVVASESVEGDDRTDELVACEAAVEDALAPGEKASATDL